MRTTYLNTLPEHWQPVAAVFAAMGDTTRQSILLLFEPGEELSIKDIAAAFDFDTVAAHIHHRTDDLRGGAVALKAGKETGTGFHKITTSGNGTFT